MLHKPSNLRVDLRAIAENWRLLNRYVGAGCECAAVVKANAYGLGVVKVAPALFQAGCREFFVATLDEGLELRGLLKDCKIYVFQGIVLGRESEFVAAQLVPVLISLPMLDHWMAYVDEHEVSYPVALKVNTGMNRFGLDVAEVTARLESHEAFMRDGVELLMTHLACADEPGHALNSAQLDSFNRLLVRYRSLSPGLRASLSNSSGVFLGDAYHFDLVRPGASIYGINPCPVRENPMECVVTLNAPVIQRRSVAKGQSIGYGATYVFQEDTEVILVPAGYADGLLRASSNNAEAWFGGYRLPLRGIVSMDAIAFDLSGVPVDERPDVGAEVELIGEHITVDQFAAAAGTIGYEVFSRLGSRLQWEYLS